MRVIGCRPCDYLLSSHNNESDAFQWLSLLTCDNKLNFFCTYSLLACFFCYT